MDFMQEDNFSEWYHKVLAEAGLVDDRYAIKGMTVMRGWGMFVVREIRDRLERMLEADGHEPTNFPVLIPEDVLAKETEHVAGFEEQVFWVTHAGANKLERKMALRPTSETAMYPMFALWVRSHTDLPVKIHQSVAVYRYETKHTRPLIRGREFLWNEGHTAFASNEEAEENIAKIKEIYGELISGLLCLPYQVNQRPDWDKFPGAQYSIAFETLMPDGKTLQLATAHNLGQNFSKVFDLKFESEDGSHKHCFQTSYGPGFGRLLAAAAAVHGDERGLVLPPAVAPVQAVIIPIIFKKEGSKVKKYVEEIKKALSASGVRVKVDESDRRPGAKYYEWEQKGVPVRIEVGPRDLEARKVTVVRRDTREKAEINFKGLADSLQKIFKEIEENLRKSAQESFDKRQFKAKTVKELEERVGEGIVSAGWCGEDACAKPIDELGTILTVTGEKAKCVQCGADGRIIRVAKSY